MKLGQISVSPWWFAVAILNLIVSLFVVAMCAYWLWFILSDWPHITFTRCVAMLFCFFFGGLQLELRFRQALQWRRVLFPRS
jgi:hypothetical protein